VATSGALVRAACSGASGHNFKCAKRHL
jgi:hypothetical protein